METSGRESRVVYREEIERLVDRIDLVPSMEGAFVAYSQGRAVVPPVGELLFEHPPGDAHIKYGYLKGDRIFVVKVATGFYENARQGLPANSGLVLVFDQRTGLPDAVLLDEGLLTNLRTAAAGAVAAKHLANPNIERIAVLGAGVQARLQLKLLKRVTDCRNVALWSRRTEATHQLAADLDAEGFTCTVASSAADAVRLADLIVTATASTSPLLEKGQVKAGAHITAMGSDTPEKQELSASLVASADVVVADSRSQCVTRGELHHAVEAGLVAEGRIVELGQVIGGLRPGRTGREQITIADLTGVAVQDIAIAKAVLALLEADSPGNSWRLPV